jgi:8-amino-7-oxononanoate synthase
MNADSSSFAARVSLALDKRAETHLKRWRAIGNPIDATHVTVDGRRCVNFAANNYLGLTHHPAVVRAMSEAVQRYGVGSGASGLVTGFTAAHASAERAVARWKGTESAVLLPSGYQANHAAVQTIAAVAEQTGTSVRFLLDKLVHASLVDAVRASGAAFRVFPHNGLVKLERLLSDAPPGATQVVVTESIFSMDGDAADLRGLAELKRKFPFVLLVDEAHGSGVYGPAGSGLAAELGFADSVDIFVVTLSKALGLVGGAVCASAGFCDALINFGRAYVYSTSVPPALAATAEAALAVLRDEPHRQQRLRHLARAVRARLTALGVRLPPGDSPIVPVIFGSEESALSAASDLLRAGLLVPAIRPPTVPKGTSRLRVTLSCEHTDAEIAALLDHAWSL